MTPASHQVSLSQRRVAFVAHEASDVDHSPQVHHGPQQASANTEAFVAQPALVDRTYVDNPSSGSAVGLGLEHEPPVLGLDRVHSVGGLVVHQQLQQRVLEQQRLR